MKVAAGSHSTIQHLPASSTTPVTPSVRSATTVSAVKEDVTHSLITEVLKDPIFMVFIDVDQGR